MNPEAIHHIDASQQGSQSRPVLLAVAWIAVLFASPLAVILWSFFSVQVPIFVQLIPSIGVALLFIVSLLLATLRPLRGFLVALLASTLGWLLLVLIFQSTLWQHWTKGVPWGLAQLAEQVLRLVPAVLIAVTFVGSGLGRRELFLVKGDLKAPVRPSKMLFWVRRPYSWTRLAVELIIIFGVVLPLYLALTIRPNIHMLGNAIVLLPFIILAAAMNALNEEFQYRSAFLARLGPVFGDQQSLWLTAVLFGLGHWFGQPSGPIGVLLAGYAGWIWGKSMQETKGITWAWLIHFIQDVVILTFLAMLL